MINMFLSFKICFFVNPVETVLISREAFIGLKKSLFYSGVFLLNSVNTSQNIRRFMLLGNIKGSRMFFM